MDEKLPNKESKIMTIGNEGLNQEIKQIGFVNANLLEFTEHGMTEKEFSDYQVDPQIHAVVKGVCGTFDFRKVAVASLYLQNPEVEFVATNEDHTFITGMSMRRMPDVGASLRPIEASCGRKAFTVGKPMPYALEIILKDHFAADKDKWKDPAFLDQFVYVGDNMETDIGFAKSAGIHSCLVMTGMTKLTDEIPDDLWPDVFMNAFSEHLFHEVKHNVCVD